MYNGDIVQEEETIESFNKEFDVAHLLNSVAELHRSRKHEAWSRKREAPPLL